MGIRGELFSTRFACDGRTYFFNVKQNRNGDVFLSVVESKPSEGESFDRRSIVVFAEHMGEFLNSFQAALKFIDKTGFKVAPDPSAYSGRSNDDEGERPRRGAESRPRRDGEGSSERKPARRAIVRTGSPSSRSKDYSERTRPSAPAGRTTERTGRTLTGRAPTAGKAPAGSTRGADKPVKRIVVRKTKKPDAQD